MLRAVETTRTTGQPQVREGTRCAYFDVDLNHGITSFDSVPIFFITFVQAFTFDDWATAMYGLMAAFTPVVWVYFILMIMILNWSMTYRTESESVCNEIAYDMFYYEVENVDCKLDKHNDGRASARLSRPCDLRVVACLPPGNASGTEHFWRFGGISTVGRCLSASCCCLSISCSSSCSLRANDASLSICTAISLMSSMS